VILVHLISSFYLANSVAALASAELIFIFAKYKIVSGVSEFIIFQKLCCSILSVSLSFMFQEELEISCGVANKKGS
jgi:hypothetical protein